MIFNGLQVSEPQAPPLCRRCHLNPPTPKHRWCRACQTAATRAYRERRRTGQPIRAYNRRATGMTGAVLIAWLLVGVPDPPPSWVIRGGYESREACEAARQARIDGPQHLCVRVGQ